MKKEFIQKHIEENSCQLIELAKSLTWNQISDNCLFIISEIKHSNQNFFEQFKIRIKENENKIPKPLTEVVPILENLYPNLYDVNLYVYKANKDETIIEIQYYPRSSLDVIYREKVSGIETMLHCKVAMPPNYSDNKEKFDIHWQFNL